MNLEKDVKDLVSMREILEWAIKREETSYDFYMLAKERSRTPAEAELFEFLAKQELEHKDTLQRQLDSIDAQVDIDRALSYDVY
jgi:rubrerythrin